MPEDIHWASILPAYMKVGFFKGQGGLSTASGLLLLCSSTWGRATVLCASVSSSGG